jgi:hypothetical protein
MNKKVRFAAHTKKLLKDYIMNIINNRNYLIINFIFLFIIGCGNQESKIVGKWISQETKDEAQIEIEFFDNYTFLTNIGDNGSWKLLKDERIQLQFVGGIMGTASLKDNNILTHKIGFGYSNRIFKRAH